MKLDFTSVWQYWPFLYHGALLTLKITAICAVLGFLLGIVLALVKISKYKLSYGSEGFIHPFSGERLSWCSCVLSILDCRSCWVSH